MTVPSGSILTPEGWVRGTVQIAPDGRIATITGRALPPGTAPEPPFVLPGFIDLHVHGGAGHDGMDGEAALRGMLRYHAAHGTVALAPTTVTAAAAAIRSTLADIARIQGQPGPGEPLVLGAHLEGPFINPARLGAQAPATLDGDAVLAEAWAGECPIVVATVAPEIPGGLAVIRTLARHRCRVQIGHSIATDAESEAAFVCGCSGFTHLFNAMTGMHHRTEGIAGYALAHADYAELICDLCHVQPSAIHAARRAIPRVYAITDATTASGLPDGEYRFVGRRVIKRGPQITLEDGETLAGSAITMHDALRNLVAIGVPLAEASAMTAARQAAYLGRSDLGRIVPGSRASVLRLDDRLGIEAMWIDGVAMT